MRRSTTALSGTIFSALMAFSTCVHAATKPGWLCDLEYRTGASAEERAATDIDQLKIRAAARTSIRAAANAAAPRLASDAANRNMPALNPPLMAIGDSLFNGITTLSIDHVRAMLSVPASVARSLGMNVAGLPPQNPDGVSFRIPKYPRPILFDLEVVLSQPIGRIIDTFQSDLVDNIHAWQADYEAKVPEEPLDYFDNIAIGAADSADLLCATPNAYQSDMAQQVSGPIPANDFLKWHVAINARYLLNPHDVSEYRDLSQLAWVLARRPKTLLVNIGNNDGVWKMAFEGAPSARLRDALDTYVKNMAFLAEMLAEEPQIEQVYVTTIVPPSRVPNLRPRFPSPSGPCKDGPRDRIYFDFYDVQISDIGLSSVSKAEACAMDSLVDGVNRRVEAAMRRSLGGRLVIVHTDKLLWRFDYKHHPDGSLAEHRDLSLNVMWGNECRHLDNRVPYRGAGFAARQGGIAGYDNMHPTEATYARIAQEIVADMRSQHAAPSLCGQPPAAADVTPQEVTTYLHDHNVTTSMNMTITQFFNLELARTYLGAIGPGRPTVAAAGSFARLNSEQKAGSCIVANAFSLMGRNEGPRPGSCDTLVQQYRALLH